MKFDGSSGRKPSTEARRYIYAVLAASLESDMRDPDGWVRGGIEDEFDLRRLRKEARKVFTELMRKAGHAQSPPPGDSDSD